MLAAAPEVVTDHSRCRWLVDTSTGQEQSPSPTARVSGLSQQSCYWHVQLQCCSSLVRKPETCKQADQSLTLLKGAYSLSICQQTVPMKAGRWAGPVFMAPQIVSPNNSTSEQTTLMAHALWCCSHYDRAWHDNISQKHICLLLYRQPGHSVCGAGSSTA